MLDMVGVDLVWVPPAMIDCTVLINHVSKSILLMLDVVGVDMCGLRAIQ